MTVKHQTKFKTITRLKNGIVRSRVMIDIFYSMMFYLFEIASKFKLFYLIVVIVFRVLFQRLLVHFKIHNDNDMVVDRV